MKKGKYVDMYVIMACMSGKKQKAKMQQVNKLLNKVYADYSDSYKSSYIKMESAEAETVNV